jgi:NodT family efflux transporter outer membrane factor (OMF) lipoprotein
MTSKIYHSIEKLRTQLRAPVLGSLLVLAAVGCSGVAPRAPALPPETLPAQWQAAGGAPTAGVRTTGSDAEVLATWWRQLDDPTLDRLIERALAGNLDLQSALTRVTEARARRGIARAALLPTVDAGVSASAVERRNDGQGVDEGYGIGLDTSWEIDLFGGRRLAIAASQADLEATIDDFHGAQVLLLADLVATYVDLRAAEARLALLRSSIGTREETLELTGWREQAGLVSTLELAQARSNLDQTRATIPNAEQSVVIAKAQLAILAGEPPGALDELLAVDPARTVDPLLVYDTTDGLEPLPLPERTLAVGIPADTLRQRPDLRAAERRVAAALARLGEAEAARYPSLRLSGSLNHDATSLGDLIDPDALVGSLFGSLTAPIFDGGRIRQTITIQDAALERAELDYRSVALQALGEVEIALSGYRKTVERLAFLDQAILAAREAAALADDRYEAGLIDLLVVLDTQRTLLSLEEQRVAARADLTATFSTLYRALGGGWTSTLPGAENG